MPFDDLPAGLRALIEKSFALNDRIMTLDRALDQPLTAIVTPITAQNPVGAQISEITKAFTIRH